MRNSHKNAYVPGQYWVECDRCGFDYLSGQMRLEYTGLFVCPKCFDSKPIKNEVENNGNS